MQDGANYSIENLALPPGEAENDTLDLDYQGFISAFLQLLDVDSDLQWVRGDLAAKYARKFSEEGMATLARDIKVQLTTLQQYKRISERYRRREDRQLANLSWSHYRAAAGSDSPQEWLRRASEEDWTVAQLMNEMRMAGDRAVILGGKPCAYCGEALPERGTWFTRRDGENHAYCSTEHALRGLMEAWKAEHPREAETP